MHAPSPRSLPAPRQLLAAGLMLLAGCTATPFDRPLDLDRMAVRHGERLQEQEALEAEFAARHPVPQTIELGDGGTLIVRTCRLDGRLGSEVVSSQLTYVNTTGRPIRRGRIIVAVTDPESGSEHTVSEDMFLPFGLRFHANSTCTTTMSVPTHGLHLREGWQWEARVETEFYEPPTD